MAQQNINFGSGPDDPNADVIRAAFAKCQNNFSELYKSSASSGVTELLVGTGLTQDNTTGKINVSANINQVKVSSTTLDVGINGSTGSNTATLSRGTDTIVINIGNTITTETIYNAKFGANASNQPNITAVGTLTGLTSSGVVSVTDSTVSTSKTSGALVVSGGVGIGGNMYANTVNSSEILNVGATASATNTVKLQVDSPTGQTANIARFSKSSVDQVWITSTGNVQTINSIIADGNIQANTTITAPQLKSTIATGTQPLTVISTTQVDNLNANLLNGFYASQSSVANTIVTRYANNAITVESVNANSISSSAQSNITQLGTLTSLTTSGQITSQVSSGTAPLVIASNTLVANLNANLLNGLTTAIPATPSTIVVRSSNGDITANNFIGTMSSTSISVVDNSANNAVTITQLGSGNAFVVTDEPTDTTVFLISNSGAVGIGVNTSISTNAKLEVLGNVKVTNHLTVSTTHSVSGAGLKSLVSYSSSLYRSSKHHIQISQASKYQASEVLLIHDGTTAYLTEYGVVYSSTDLGTISAALSGGSVNLQITLTDTGNTASITVLSDITLI